MLARLCLGLGAFICACTAGASVVVFTIGDFVSRWPVPASAQLLALAITVVSVPVAYIALLGVAKA